MPKGYRRATHEGTTYYVPGINLLPVRMYDATFDEMSLNFAAQGRTVLLDTNNNRHNFVALTDCADYELTLTLSALPFNLTCEDNPQVLAALYRKDTPTPLHIGPMALCNDELVYRIPALHLPAGEYYALFAGITNGDECLLTFDELGDHPVYRFEILEHGANLRHPAFSHTLPIDRNYLLLSAMDGAYTDKDEYRYVCFADNYRPVHEEYAENRNPCYDLTVYLTNPHWPVDDTYHLVLYHNNEPFMACHYQVQGGAIKDLQVKTLTAGDAMYVLGKQVLQHPMKDGFCNEPGCKALKDLVLKQLAAPTQHRRSHLAVVTTNEPSWTFISAMLDMLYGPGVEDYENMNPAYLQGEYENLGAACFRRTFRAKAVYLYDIPYLLLPENRALLQDLDGYIAHSGRKFHFFGTKQDIQALLDRLPESRGGFDADHRLTEAPFTTAEVTCLTAEFLKVHDYRMTPGCVKAMQGYAEREYHHFEYLTLDGVRQWVDDYVVPQLHEQYGETDPFNPLELKDVEIDFGKLPSGATQPMEDTAFENCMAELNRMVGLHNLKQSLGTLFDRTRFDRMRVKMGLPALTENRHHMIFTGNPGTGKTTVAKMIGKVFKELGILSKGEVITVERADMVGKYIGHTEEQMKNLLEKAKGNVLFIDEAYSLCDNRPDDRADYGHRALECLLTALASNESDLIVIMAGYEKQMNQMLEMNPGMRGRFAYQFNFEDYTAEELTEICVNKLLEKEFVVAADVRSVLLEHVRRAVQDKEASFHNARWAEQFAMVGIVSAMAGRIARSGYRQAGLTDLCNILAEDVVNGFELSKQWSKATKEKKPVRSIGFR